MKQVWKSLVLGGLLLPISLVWAVEPTLDQVFEATKNGRFGEAKQMMQEVLKAHPNSAKAHFVEAEVLARSGDLAEGRNELALAQKLQPGLPFASATAVSGLQTELNRAVGGGRISSDGHSTPWGMIFLVGGLAILLVVWLARRQAAHSSMMMPGMGSRPMGGGYYNNGMGGVPPGSPLGGGGGLMSSLATGAALGAGMVAGEALAHRLVDGPEGSTQSTVMSDNPANADMGGRDFGVSDAGSWGSGGDSGWSSGDSGGGDWT